MEEKNYHILKRAVSELPEFKLKNECLWLEISEKIASKPSLADRLPQFDAPQDLWNKVETGLKPHPVNKRLKIPRYIRSVAAAAAFLIILGVSWHVIRQARTKTIDRYDSMAELDPDDPNEDVVQILVFDPAMCKSNPQICRSPLFKELDKQWTEVKGEIDLIQSEMPKDPQFTRYFYRLNELRIEIEKKMMKLILES